MTLISQGRRLFQKQPVRNLKVAPQDLRRLRYIAKRSAIDNSLECNKMSQFKNGYLGYRSAQRYDIRWSNTLAIWQNRAAFWPEFAQSCKTPTPRDL